MNLVTLLAQDGIKMEVFELLLPIALILFLAKLFGLGAQKIGMPAVIGMLIAGLLLSLLHYIPGVEAPASGTSSTTVGQFIYNVLFSNSMKEGLSFFSKIGVVLIMFSAGMETNLTQIKSTGVAAMVITMLGVILPMALGFAVAFLFDYYTDISLYAGDEGLAGNVNLLADMFYGAILTATSVSITVATLKEIGKLNTAFGSAIVSAAVIDDIIGIIILSVLTGLSGSGNGGSTELIGSWVAPGPLLVVVKIILFFVFAVSVGLIVRKLFKWLGTKYAHHRRNPIFAVALGFFFAYIAEKAFGVADITGAYIAGILLCGLEETGYEEQKVENLSYMLFTPIFFVNIGLGIDLSSFSDGLWIAFGVCYIVAALLGKLVGCGAGGLLCKYNLSDSTKIGLGMMVRAEVVLVCANKGIDSMLVSDNVLTYVCIIIIASSLLAPAFIKMLSKKDDEKLAARHISQQV